MANLCILCIYDDPSAGLGADQGSRNKRHFPRRPGEETCKRVIITILK